MADLSKVLILGGVAVGGYLLYNMMTTPAPVAAAPVAPPVTPPATGGAMPVSTPATPTPAPSPTGPSADVVYQQLLNSVAGDGNFTGTGAATSGTPYHWNFYLQLLVPNNPLPGPDSIFTGVDVNQPMTLATYWTGIAPWLKTNAGLSGLGVLAGLGAFMLHHPRLRRVS